VRIEAILGALRRGCTRRAAAAVGGIHHSTLYEWIARDPTLADTIERAEHEAEATFTAVVAQASLTSWQAAAWWLERRRHADYARREHVEMTVDIRAEAERIAADSGLDADAVMAEAERILGR
jgi:hypothetical protein